MSSSFRERDVPSDAREETSGTGVSQSTSSSFPTWVERMHTVRARHDAITRNLNTWSNYKNWAERMRTAWNQDAAREADAPRSGDDSTAPSH